MRIKIQIFLILFILVNFAYSQVGVGYSISVNSNSEVYDYSTNKLLSKKQIEESMLNSTAVFIPKEFNNKAEPLNFYRVRNTSNDYIDFSKYYDLPEIGEKFPEFSGRTIGNENLDSDDFRGKNLIINFQLMLKHPFVLSDQIKLIDDFVDSNEAFETILFTISGESDGLNFKKDSNLIAEIVAEATSYTKKYGVFKLPMYMVLDDNGVLKGIYTSAEETINAVSKSEQ